MHSTIDGRVQRRPLIAVTILLTCTLSATGSVAEPGSAPQLRPVEPRAAAPELASYMGELGRLTHKLSLAVGAGNTRLASFYLYESIELLNEIQREVPEYDGQPIALLLDRMALPQARAMVARLGGLAPDGAQDLEPELDAVVGACNECHRKTLHGFIKITAEMEKNPFNQDFRP